MHTFDVAFLISEVTMRNSIIIFFNLGGQMMLMKGLQYIIPLYSRILAKTGTHSFTYELAYTQKYLFHTEC